MLYPHGGDTLSYREAYGRDPIDFSANLNPLGTPPAVQEAVRRSAALCAAYPDPFCRRLRHALAEHEGVAEESVLLGNGAADLIFRLAYALRPTRALLLAPTFSEYETALTAAGCSCSFYPLREEDGFRLTSDFLFHLADGWDLVFLCNPNNPTGQPIPRDLLEEILLQCEKRGTLLAVDECFTSFLDEPDAYSLKPFLAEHPKLFLLGAFTKLYAMAGLRLGWCFCSDRVLLDEMERSAQPWSVSTPAQEAGLAALSETEFVRRSRELVRTQREWLRRELTALGMQVYGSHANYMFFRSPVADLGEMLKQDGILLRSCANYRALGPDYYRAAVRLPQENEALIRAMRHCLGKGDNTP